MSSPGEPESETCDQCGKAIPAWAPGGNCPTCLLGTKPAGSGNRETAASMRERIGDWELIDRIGEGAFGVVYSAEQLRPVKRSAAIKILRPGMASKEVLARFQAESQALALMNHPDIVTIYGADATEDGRPYLVMELVPGVPITEYAKGLPVSQKLVLFDRVCAVVEHAHRHGIIHRDLKPGNILVYSDEGDGKPVLKLLDFGLAKATEQVLTEATILTSKDHFLGTPEYMSPEQARGSDVDTRSDVYSLGVILFELLAGQPPFVLQSRSLDDVFDFLARVREEEPPRASDRAEVEFQADLDWIAAKAIEKDRERRYRSVAALREDLRRFGRDEPISARPPDTLYLAKKFIRRHWKVTGVATAIAFSVVTAAVVSGIMAVKARKASKETRSAYSESDLRSAVDELDRGNIARSIAYQVRSLRTDSENSEANRLLRSTLDQFPIAEQITHRAISDESIRDAHFFGDEGNAATISQYGTIRFIGPNGSQIAPEIFIGGTNHYTQIAPAEDILAVTNIQGEIYYFDLTTYETVFQGAVGGGAAQHSEGLEFSVNGKYLCMLSSDRSVSVRDGRNGELLWRKQFDEVPISVAFSHLGEKLAVAFLDGRRVDFVSADGEIVTDVPQQPERVHWLVPEGSGYRYYTVSTAGIVAACDNGREPRTFTEEQVDVPLVFSAFDPKRRLTAYFSGKEVSVWTVMGVTIIRRLPLPNPPTSVDLNPDKDLMYIGTAESGILLWDFENRELFGSQLSRAKNTTAVRIYPEKNLLRCITVDGFLQAYKVHDPRHLPETSQGLTASWQNIPLSRRSDAFIRSKDLNVEFLKDFPTAKLWNAAMNENGDLVFGMFRNGTIHIWDRSSGGSVETISVESDSVRCLDVTADGRLLAFRDKFGEVALYDRQSKQKRGFSPEHGRDYSALSISPDEKFLATASDDGSLLISDIETLKPVTKVMQHDVRGEIARHYCRFSPTGKWLLSWGAPDRAFRIWDGKTGEPVGVPIRAEGVPHYAQFEGNDEFLVTVFARDRESMSFRIWSLDSFVPISPERTIRENDFDFSNIAIPEADVFSEKELAEIEYRNGIRLGENGIIEVPLNAAE